MLASSAIALLAVLAAVGLSACGGGGSSSSGSTGSTSGGSEGEGGSGGGPAKSSVAWALKFIGGKEGAAVSSKTPIKIGYVNQQGGSFGFPDITDAFEAGVAAINEELGGIEGHPIEVTSCYIQSEEDGQKCGTELANAGVSTVINGQLAIGAAPFFKIVTPKAPVFTASAIAAPELTSENSFVWNAGASANFATSAVIGVEKFGAKTIAVPDVDTEAGKYLCEQTKEGLSKSLGVKVVCVFYPENATAPQVASGVQAANAGNAEMFLAGVPEESCAPIYQALQTLGLSELPVVASYPCWATPVEEALGGHPAEEWYFAGYGANPRMDTDPAMMFYKEKMEEAGKTDSIGANGAAETFAALFMAAKLADEVGAEKVTPEAMSKAAAAYKGEIPMILGGVKADCGVNSESPAACLGTTRVDQYKEGEWKTVPGFLAFKIAG